MSTVRPIAVPASGVSQDEADSSVEEASSQAVAEAQWAALSGYQLAGSDSEGSAVDRTQLTTVWQKSSVVRLDA